MAIWKWKAVDEQGNIYRGLSEEPKINSVVSGLRRQKLYPVEIRKAIVFGSLWFQYSFANGKLFWARTARKISMMLNAGIPLLTVLEIVADKEANNLKKNQWEKVSRSLQAGDDLSTSFSGVIPPPGSFFYTMIQAGERSGTLAACFMDIAKQFEEEHIFEQKIKTAMFYPGLLLVIALAVLYAMSRVILPMYQSLFQGFEAELPFITRLVFGVGSIVPFLTGTVSIIGLTIFLLRKKHGIKGFPGISTINNSRDLIQFCSLLERLLNAGLTLSESLLLMEKIAKGTVLIKMISELKLAVQEGRRLSPVLVANNFFPFEAAKMIEVAEESGKLCEMLRHMTKIFSQELEEKIQRYTKLLEPVLVLGMAGVVGLVAVGVFLPIFDISKYIR